MMWKLLPHKSVKVPLYGSATSVSATPLGYVSSAALLWVRCPVIPMTDDDVEQYWTQYSPLEYTTSHWLELCTDGGRQILSFAKIAVGIFKAARLRGLAFTGPDMSP
ncbi:hypothetical protein DUI87_13035 [Hirundo rustica rustica]|uniref:Uncharacterized protein n=1 Tax=Hirundo rustica rustica TaxID=333673 RepID=A0A3M0KAK3_HIRRU|nr:hypothetical protein DUI87_13035 [Hirundo rustica rustica]